MSRLARQALLTIAAAAAMVAIAAAPAAADFGLKDLDATYTDAEGSPSMLAGTHPFAYTVNVAVNTKGSPEIPDGELKDLVVSQPPGLAGTPTPVPPCSTAEFLSQEGCPNVSAVGVAEVLIQDHVEIVPVVVLPAQPGVTAKLGFKALGLPVTIGVTINPDPPYNLLATAENVYSQVAPFYSARLILWGVPADPAHDSERGTCAGPGAAICHVGLPEVPFLTLPTRCDGPLATTFKADSWEQPGAWVQETIFTHDDSEPPQPLGLLGCGNLEFTPEIEAQPTSHSAQSPSGLDFYLTVDDPGLTAAGGTAQSQIKTTEVTLPEGVTVNPSQAAGLGACSEAELANESAAGAPGSGCPQSSKVGTVEVETPLLEDTVLNGNLYLATPYENRFGTLIALYMVVKDPKLGVLLRIAGTVEPDPQSGRLTAVFEDLPQFPFSSFHLHFNEGARSPLVTPPGCGSYETTALLTPYSGNPPRQVTASFEISSGIGGGPCPSGPEPFHPGFLAGSDNNAAGAFSPFAMRITRTDAEGELTRFDGVLPRGLTGKIAGLARCPDAAIAAAGARSGREELAAPSCPAGSELGSVLAGAGVGPELTYVSGRLYLAGPFAGHPLSIAVITPAVAGPFDLGTVVVREALDINPLTAEVELSGAASDPIPRILAGIPLRLRDLRVFADRPGFALNPTSCKTKATAATLFGPASFQASSRYQASSCASLVFKPKLSIALKGGTKRSGHPALTATLTPRPGDANLGNATVLLPKTEFIDQAHISNPCTRVQFNADQCPPGSVLGTARAFTPLLEAPLEGPVYFRSNGGERKLPDIVLDLHGEFRIIQVGFVDSRKGRLRTRFTEVPDAPVSKLVLKLKGGKEGLLVNNTDLCAKKRTAEVHLIGQNGRRSDSDVAIKTSCGKK